MLFVVGILVISSILVGYLIWSGGGMAKPTEEVAVAPTLPGFAIRIAQSSDVAVLLRIAGETEAMQAQGWDQAALDQAKDGWASLSSDEVERVFIVAEADSGEVAGFTPFGVRENYPDQLSIGLHVSQSHGGHGVGTALMRTAILHLQTSEVHGWVGTATSNVAVQKIMERLGFSPEPEIESYAAPNGEVFDSLWYKVGVGTRPPR